MLKNFYFKRLDFVYKDISWMGLTEDKKLYVGTSVNITIWKIMDFIDLWASTK